MFKRNTLLAVFTLAVAAAPAFGEGNWEVQPFVGYKFRTPDTPLKTFGKTTYLRTWVRTKTCPLF
jgi:hypothetical protein